MESYRWRPETLSWDLKNIGRQPLQISHCNLLVGRRGGQEKHSRDKIGLQPQRIQTEATEQTVIGRAFEGCSRHENIEFARSTSPQASVDSMSPLVRTNYASLARTNYASLARTKYASLARTNYASVLVWYMIIMATCKSTLL